MKNKMKDFIDQCYLSLGKIPISARGRAMYALTATPEQLAQLEKLRTNKQEAQQDILNEANSKSADAKD